MKLSRSLVLAVLFCLPVSLATFTGCGGADSTAPAPASSEDDGGMDDMADDTEDDAGDTE